MNLISRKSNALSGEITVPGDKSISHRAVILGSIAKGTTKVKGFLSGHDCLNTVKAFQSMGVAIESPSHDELLIHGVGKYGLLKPKTPIDCGNSGTTMRLLSGLLAPQAFDSQLIGDSSLLKRPMGRVSRPLLQMGADIITHDFLPPIEIHGANLEGICYEMPEASAQVKSCLLLAGMYAKGETTVIEPGLTRDHTERLLTTFSYPIQKSENTIRINSLSECIACELEVPGDISSAAFFIVAATLIPNSALLLKNIGINPTRTGVIQILKRMGAHIDVINKRLFGEEPVADLYIRSATLEGIDISQAMVPITIDEFPILFIAAAMAKGQTILHGAKELRLKESDRISAMVDGLSRLGIMAEALEDGIFIKGGTLKGGEVESFNDHRIAMSFAIAGAVAEAPITIKDCDNIATSFPSFLQLAKKLQMDIKDE